MFPDLADLRETSDCTKPRNPRNFSKEFARKAEQLGFGFHDLRAIHSTALLDAGIPVHTIGQRIGDDLAVLLRNYTKRKRTKKADESVASAIAALSAGFLSGPSSGS
jgi:integrase